MDVDFDDATLEDFLSPRADVRRRSSELLERWRQADPGGLAQQLAARVASAAAGAERRSLAAVLLRKVLTSQDAAALLPRLDGTTGNGSSCARPGLGDALLEALVACVQEPSIRPHACDAVAAAASVLFSRNLAWPEFSVLLAKWSSNGDRAERSSVLRVLEHLGDEAVEETHGDEGSKGVASAGTGALHALLAFLEDHGGALHTLLVSAWSDSEDKVSRDAAARVFASCFAGAGTPKSLRDSLSDLAPALAAAVTEPWEAAAPIHSEACLQAVALAVRADPSAWSPEVSGPCVAALPAALATIVANARADVATRSAALAALVELTSAALAADTHWEAAEELIAHTTACVAGLLAELPYDETTESWAESANAGDVDGRQEADIDVHFTEGPETLLEDALDAGGRLAAHGGATVEALRNAAARLMSCEAWQAQHGGLLLQLRLACIRTHASGSTQDANDESTSVCVAISALRHLAHVHPRVRWAAAEVWARLLASGLGPATETFGEGFAALLDVAGCDPYERTRRRGLLVLLLASRPGMTLLTARHIEPLFRKVLVPQAASPHSEVREACATIAQGIGINAGLDGQGAGAGPEVQSLWHDLFALLAGAEAAADEGVESHDHKEDIVWPSDWR